MDGSATAIDGDYLPVVNQELTFTPNLAEIEVPVAVIGEDVVELDESFFAVISDSTGPVIVDAIFTGIE